MSCDFEIHEIAKYCWEGDQKFSWDTKRLLIENAGLFLGRSRNHTFFE